MSKLLDAATRNINEAETALEMAHQTGDGGMAWAAIARSLIALAITQLAREMRAAEKGVDHE